MSKTIIVKKFGGSMLKSEDDFLEVTKNISSDCGKHKQIVVLSAPYGKTDKLIHKINKINPKSSVGLQSLLLATGEQESLSLIGLHLEEQGITTDYMYGPGIPIFTKHGLTNAEVVSVAKEKIQRKLKENDVLLIAGFQGLCIERQQTSTFGRGGSDLTASVLASILKCPCFFYKDTGGIGKSIDGNYKNLYDTLNYEEIVNLSHNGARVLNDKASLILSAQNIEAYFGSLLNRSKTKIKRISVKRIDNILIERSFYKITLTKLDTTILQKINKVLYLVSIEQREGLFTIIGQKKIAIDLDTLTLNHLECFMVGNACRLTSLSITGSGLIDDTSWIHYAVGQYSDCIYKVLCNQFKVSIVIDDKKNEDALAIKKALIAKIEELSS